jgi:DNA-binding NtrC family response regulator
MKMALQEGDRLDDLGFNKDFCRLAENVRDVINNGTELNDLRLECFPDGTCRVMSICVTPLDDGTGVPAGAVLVFRNMSQHDWGLKGDKVRLHRLIGASPAMQQAFLMIENIGRVDSTVLITGESGTGKELVAQAIVEFSTRRHRPFIPLDCGAISPTLIESELFGHERGSFTGATQMRRGHFEQASGGTLFLDEITEMPVELQVKLLRVLESGTLNRVGGETRVPVAVRLIAASNRPPHEAIQDGKLREDLYYRLNVFPITLPPLRERNGDALMLADEFLNAINRAEGTTKRFSDAARARIVEHPWPGNVRELKNEIQRAFIMAEKVLEMDDLTPRPRPAAAARPGAAPPPENGSLGEAERRLILATLERCSGDKKRAAEILGVSLKTLYNRLHLYAKM